MSEKLLMAFRRIIREEIRTELSLFRQEILNEIRNQSPIKEKITESKPIRRANPSNPPRKTLLQTILEETDPIDDDMDYIFEEKVPKPSPKRIIEQPKTIQPVHKPIPVRTAAPIVTEDIDGRPINLQNPKVREVLDIMNMNFGAKLKQMEEHAKRARGH